MVINVDNNKLHYLTPKLTQKWDMLSYWDKRELLGRKPAHYQLPTTNYQLILWEIGPSIIALEYLKLEAGREEKILNQKLVQYFCSTETTSWPKTICGCEERGGQNFKKKSEYNGISLPLQISKKVSKNFSV